MTSITYQASPWGSFGSVQLKMSQGNLEEDLIVGIIAAKMRHWLLILDRSWCDQLGRPIDSLYCDSPAPCSYVFLLVQKLNWKPWHTKQNFPLKHCIKLPCGLSQHWSCQLWALNLPCFVIIIKGDTLGWHLNLVDSHFHDMDSMTSILHSCIHSDSSHQKTIWDSQIGWGTLSTSIFTVFIDIYLHTNIVFKESLKQMVYCSSKDWMLISMTGRSGKYILQSLPTEHRGPHLRWCSQLHAASKECECSHGST